MRKYSFGKQVLIWLGSFFGGSLVLLFLTDVLFPHCGNGVCDGFVPLMIGTPLVFLLFVGSGLTLYVRRLKELQMNPMWVLPFLSSLFVPLLIPIHVVLFTVFLVMLPAKHHESLAAKPALDMAWNIARALAGLVFICGTFGALLWMNFFFSGSSRTRGSGQQLTENLNQVLPTSNVLQVFLLLIYILYSAVLIYILYQTRGGGLGDPGQQGVPPTPRAPRQVKASMTQKEFGRRRA